MSESAKVSVEDCTDHTSYRWQYRSPEDLRGPLAGKSRPHESTSLYHGRAKFPQAARFPKGKYSKIGRPSAAIGGIGKFSISLKRSLSHDSLMN